MYFYEHGVIQDYQKTIKWFEIAEFYGHDNGQPSRDEAALKHMTRAQITYEKLSLVFRM